MSGMSILRPHVITDAMLISSTVVDVAPAAYAAGTTYALAATSSVAGANGLITIYKSLQSANIGHTPASSPTWWAFVCTTYQQYAAGTTYAALERAQDNTTHLIYESAVAGNVGQLLTNVLKWTKVGSTGRWGGFDNVIGTSVAGASPLTMVLKPNLSTTGLMLFDLNAGTAQVTVRDTGGGTVVYSKSLILDGTVIDTVYDWFFADASADSVKDIVLTDLPGQYFGAEITITLASSAGSPIVSAGVVKPGIVTHIGVARPNAKVGIIDYSKKTPDAFGNVEFVQRAFVKTASFAITTEAGKFNNVFRTLAAARATPCVYIGTEVAGYEPLLVYGVFRSFSIDVEYFDTHLCNLDVEGLT